jgi:hypothetical protein
MPRVTDLPALRTAARERADVREAYIGNAQLNRLINAQLARLYRLLVKVNKDFYYDEQTVSVVAGTADYALAADFWRVLGVDVQDGTNWYSLLRYNFAEIAIRTAPPRRGRATGCRGTTSGWRPIPSGAVMSA